MNKYIKSKLKQTNKFNQFKLDKASLRLVPERVNEVLKFSNLFHTHSIQQELDKASLRLVPERVNGEFKNSCVTFILM